VTAAAESVDVAVVGAGPAGLAAATLAAERSLSVTLFDEQERPGGQIYRALTASPLRRPEILGDDYSAGAALMRAFRTSGATHSPSSIIWAITPRADGLVELGVSIGPANARRSEAVVARAVILAVGAHERPFPIPGWTLPGVMTAGGAQLLLKASALVPNGRTVLAGCGPLLWLVAWQLLRADVTIDALLDTTPRGRYAEAASYAWGFVRSDYFSKGMTLMREVRRHLRHVEHVTAIAAEGQSRLQSVRFQVEGATMQSIAADLLLLHQGIVPNLNLPVAAGCALRWSDRHACFEPVVDDWGGTGTPGLYIAGDVRRVSGSRAAEASGRIAALAVANALGRIDSRTRDKEAQAERDALAGAKRGRAFFDTLYRPAESFRVPEGPTIVCRCEEVSAQQIVDATTKGSTGPNQIKAYLRCGMGPCQGRMCGLTVTELIAKTRGVPPEQVGYFRQRFPAAPITLGELASLPIDEEAERAVMDDRGTH
jgi:NADPH-dependent 2,4-dienoyl-CoA reductase/sulfur reductase-like enzyme